jgi:hypothetical protein
MKMGKARKEKDLKATLSREEAEKYGTGIFAIIGFYRVRIAIALLIAGYLIFSLQGLSSSDGARPDKVMGWLVFQDIKAADEMISRLETEEGEDVEIPRSEIPPTDGHYRGKPAADFQERFDALVAEFEYPEDVIPVPVHLTQVKEDRLVNSGAVPPTVSPESSGSYFLIRMGEEHARLFLRYHQEGGTQLKGKYFLGPYPYLKAGADGMDLVLEDNSRHKLIQLSEEASALQGMIINPVDELSPNAVLLVSELDGTVGDFAISLRKFSSSLADKLNPRNETEDKLTIVPNSGFSDYRNNGWIYTAAVAGEMIFMIGGFLLIFHLFWKVAQMERKEKGFVFNNLYDTCSLMVKHGRLYALTVGIFMLFWLYGMIISFVDPGGQEKLVQMISAQLAGSSWPLGFAGQAYSGGNVLYAAVATFTVNFFWGTFVVLTVFSLVPLGTAFIINALRGQMIGLALAPAKFFFGQSLTLHLLTIVVELQAYLIAGFVSVLLPLALLKPQRFGLESRKDAFIKFVMWQFKVLPLIALILAGAAVYEAVEILVLNQIL